MAIGYLDRVRMLNRDTRLVVAAGALIGLSVDGIVPVLSSLYLIRLGYDPEFIGVLAAVGAVARIVFCPLASALGESWGSRRPMVAGVGLMVVGLTALSQAELVSANGRAWWVVSAQGLYGAGMAAIAVFTNPFLMDITAAAERSHAFAISQAAHPVGAFFGSLLGGVLPQAWAGILRLTLREAAPYRWTLLLSPLFLALALPLLWATREPAARPTGQRAAQSSPTPWGIITLMALVVLLRWAGQAPVTTFFSAYLDDSLRASPAMIGAVVAVGRLMAIPAALGMPLVALRWGVYRAFLWGTGGMFCSLLCVALIPRLGGAGLGYVGLAALFALTSPASSIYGQELVAPRWRPLMSSICNLGVGLGLAAVSLGGGYAIRALGYRALFLIGAAFMAACAVMLWGYFRAPRGEYARAGGATASN